MDPARLAPIPLFEGLTDEELATCAGRFEEVEILSDHNVTREGDFGYAFFVVLDGDVDVHHEFQRVATLHAGDFFGEMALDSGDRRNAHVSTRGRATLAKLMTWDYQDLVADFPVLDERIQAAIKDRTSEHE